MKLRGAPTVSEGDACGWKTSRAERPDQWDEIEVCLCVNALHDGVEMQRRRADIKESKVDRDISH